MIFTNILPIAVYRGRIPMNCIVVYRFVNKYRRS